MIKPETLCVRPLPEGDHPLTLRMYLAEQEIQRLSAHTGTAYLAFIFGGLFGLHRIYTGRFRTGFSQMFTLGWCGFFLIDFLALPLAVGEFNAFVRQQVNEHYGLSTTSTPS